MIAGWEWTAWVLLAAAVLPGLGLVVVFRRVHAGDKRGDGSRGEGGGWGDRDDPRSPGGGTPALAGAPDPGGAIASDGDEDSDDDGFVPIAVEH